MWLLDHNLPRQLFEVFRDSIGISVETASNRQWEYLENGDLVRTAVAAGFTCILTKDVRFHESAAKTLLLHPNFSIVLITLKQQRGPLYAKEFLSAWKIKPIQPSPGQLVI
ncbi:MAG: DUF5615 family PIN-like protein [Deltaproteobacteria bacterium]|nr:DUF5615 family PIN-like protein [Deltaproteobacteria bacterium]